MNILDYFDLNRPALGETKSAPVVVTPSPIAAPMPGGQPGAAAAVAASGAPAVQQLSLAWQIVTYVVLLLSILCSRFLDLYRVGATDQFTLDWKYLLFMAIVSLLAFPSVYDKARLSTDQPILVQLGLMFATGMGWEKIVATLVGK